MSSNNPITGDSLVSKSNNQEAYAEGWDRIFGKKKVEVVRVFPDYLSSGLWKNYCNITLNELGIDNYALEQEIYLWHKEWELNIADTLYKEYPDYVNEETYNLWYTQGKNIVDHLNNIYGYKYKFIYLADTYEEYTNE